MWPPFLLYIVTRRFITFLGGEIPRNLHLPLFMGMRDNPIQKKYVYLFSIIYIYIYLFYT